MTAAAEPVLADRAPKPPVRLTASTINDDQLDALYAERDRYAADVRRLGLMVDEYGTGASLLMDKIIRVRAVANEFAHTGEQSGAVIAFDEAAICIRTALDGPPEPRTAPTAAPVSPVGLRDALGATGGLG